MLKFGSYGVAKSVSFIQRWRHYQPFPISRSVLTTTTTSTQGNPGLVQYLAESLGFSMNQALTVSTKLSHIRQARGTKNFTDFNFLQNADSVIVYLRQIGAEQSHICNAISSVPGILLCKVDKSLKPKIQFFQKLGFSGSDFVQFVKVNTSIVLTGLETCIVPAFQALREIMGCHDSVFMLFKKWPRLRLNSVPKTLVPNVALLRSYGIPIEAIQKWILTEPYSFCRSQEYFKGTMIRVEETLGIPRDSSQFFMGIRLLSTFKAETIEAKKDIFRSFGWTESDIVALCRSRPLCCAFSVDTIKKKLEFFMNELGYKPKYLLSRVALLTCSLEKRIIPRHKVLVFLKEKGLLKMEYSVCSVNRLNENQFLQRFVIPFKEVHEVYAKHGGISLEMPRNSNTA